MEFNKSAAIGSGRSQRARPEKSQTDLYIVTFRRASVRHLRVGEMTPFKPFRQGMQLGIAAAE